MKARFFIFGLIGVVALAVGGVGCGKSAKGENPRKQASGRGGPRGPRDNHTTGSKTRREFSVPVAVTEIARRSISEYSSTVGTVAPSRSIAVKAEESGRIHFVQLWREGDRVAKGELIARLDEKDTSRSIEIAEADLEVAKNDLVLAYARDERTSDDLARAKLMRDLGQIAEKAYQEREFAWKQARNSVQQSFIRVEKARKQLEQLLLRADRKNIWAPMSGYLCKRSAIESRANSTAADSAERIVDLEGQLVGTGNVICGIVDTADVLIRCDVTSKDIAKVRKGQTALAYIYSDEEIEVTGEVTDVSPIMDVRTNAFKVDIALPNSEGRLRPGMFARVDIVIKTRRDAVVVGRKVLQRRNNEDIVFVVGEEDRAEKRVVKIGLENPDEVEILEGLRAGDKLIVLGHETLQDKVKVKITETEPTVADDDGSTTAVGAVDSGNGHA